MLDFEIEYHVKLKSDETDSDVPQAFEKKTRSMSNKFEQVLLIDDDEIDNVFHERILRKSGIDQEILSFQYADEALEYLQTEEPKRRFIFLDINMPRMNGFEFLEAYAQLPEERKGQAIIMMLTTSTNPQDYDKARNLAGEIKFHSKPLTVDAVNALVATLD